MTLRSRILVGFLLCISSNVVHAEGPPGGDVSESEKLMRTEFGSGSVGLAILVSTSKSGATAEVCADKCDVFEWNGSPRKPEAWDFILLYELKVGYGSDSKSFQENAQRTMR